MILLSLPQKLIFLTSDEKISPDFPLILEKDEGIHLQYGKLKAFLLPEECQALTNPKEILATLKQMIGINPDYATPSIRLYKFKTTEVILNEKI